MTRTERALAVVGIALFAAATPAASSAQTVWDPAVGGNGHAYQAVGAGTPISWEQARAAARALGSGWDLATISTAKEDAFVKSLFDDNMALRRFIGGRCGDPDLCGAWLGPWIGGFNVTAPDAFQWVTGEPVSFTAWAPQSIYTSYLFTGHEIAYVLRGFSGGWSDSSYFAWGRPSYWPVAYVAESPGSSELLGLTLTRAVVAGCKTVKATVTLPRPAPFAGVVVKVGETLASASSPSSLTIPAGETRGTFTVSTTPVAAREKGTVLAKLGGTTLTTALTVRPMGLAFLTLPTPTVVGGTKTIGKATLECKAAPGPITVELGSSKPTVAHPVAASITVPQGLRSGTFDIATNTVTSTTTVNITGVANGRTRSKELTVTPATQVSTALH